MNTNNNNNNLSLSYAHDMQGIFFDYLIDTNRFNSMDNPAYNYENFQACNKWEVVKVIIDEIPYLMADVKLLSFSYFRYVRIENRVLKSGLTAYEAKEELKAYSKFLGIDILDPIKYYSKGIPSVIENL